jgi:hypothetical protein
MEDMKEIYLCKHKWKIIRAEEGKEGSLLNAILTGKPNRDIIIYHLCCEKCGSIISRHADVCRRSEPHKILKKINFNK